MDGSRWAVVLAGGDGARVQDVIRRTYGLAQPKQFCRFGGTRSLLRQTLDRAMRLVPPERVVAVVSGTHRSWWERELGSVPSENVVVQPSNRGTAAGVLAGLFRVLRIERAPVQLLFLPSDHRVRDETRLHAALGATQDEAARGRRLVLVGMSATRPESGYGWIVPSADGDGTARRVEEFVEKPPPATIATLLTRAALVNSFIFAVSSPTLVSLYARVAPDLLRQSLVIWRSLRPGGSSSTCVPPRCSYDRLETLDFSRHVLEKVREQLAVIRADDCGWADLGTPDRLERHLADLYRPLSFRALEQTP